MFQCEQKNGKCRDGLMPKVVAFSRDGYTVNVKDFKVLLEPTLVLPLSNLSKGTLPVSMEILMSPDTIFTILHPYNPGNMGHFLGDDIFSTFLSLSLFAVQHAKNIVVVVLDAPAFSGRQLDLLNATMLHSLTFAQLQNLCIPGKVVVGLSQFSFVRPTPHGYGHMLDIFSAWLSQRFFKTQNSGNEMQFHKEHVKLHHQISNINLVFTVIQKNFSTSSSPHGMNNGVEVGKWLQEAYPNSTIR